MVKRKTLKKTIATSLAIAMLSGSPVLAAGETGGSGQLHAAAPATSAQGQGVSVEDYFRAAKSGDIDTVRRCLDSGIDINAKDDSGNTALMVAIQNGREEIVRELLNRGADQNVQDENGCTAFMFAVEHDGHHDGHKEIAQEPLKRDPKLDVQDDQGWTALMLAAQNGHLDVAAKLLENGADPNAQDIDADAKHFIDLIRRDYPYITIRHEDVVRWLRTDPKVFPGMLIAAEQDEDYKQRVIRRFLDYSAPQNAPTICGLNEFVQAILNRGVDPNVQDNKGCTAFMFAVEHDGHKESVQKLLNRDSDPKTGYIDADAKHFIDLIRRDYPHITIRHEDVVRWLRTDPKVFPGMLIAAEQDEDYKQRVIRRFLDYSARQNAQNTGGGIPFAQASDIGSELRMAVLRSDIGAVRALLDSGKISEEDRDIARDVAIMYGRQDVVGLLNGYTPTFPKK